MDKLNHISKIYYTEFLFNKQPLLWLKLIKLDKNILAYILSTAMRFRYTTIKNDFNFVIPHALWYTKSEYNILKWILQNDIIQYFKYYYIKYDDYNYDYRYDPDFIITAGWMERFILTQAIKYRDISIFKYILATIDPKFKTKILNDKQYGIMLLYESLKRHDIISAMYIIKIFNLNTNQFAIPFVNRWLKWYLDNK